MKIQKSNRMNSKCSSGSSFAERLCSLVKTLIPLKGTHLLLVTKIWIFLFMYIVQGIPFGLQEKYIPLHYRKQGMQYTTLSLFRLIHLPWISKIFVVPFVDKIKNKHFFVAFCLFSMAFCYFIISILGLDDFSTIIPLLLFSNFLIAFQDILLDALVISNLNENEMGYGNVAQVVGYKIGIILGGGGIAFLSGSTTLTPLVFASLSMVPLSAGLFTLIYFAIDSQLYSKNNKNIPTSNETKETNQDNCLLPKTTEEPFSFFSLLKNNTMFWTVIFVITYKLGETGIIAFFPLFLMDAGIKMDSLHWWNGIVGQIASITGSVFGGIIAFNNWAIFNHLWKFISLRASVMFLLMLFCLNLHGSVDENIHSWNYVISIILLITLSFVSGVITTLTFTLMMVVSKRCPLNSQASHYSILAVAELMGKLAMSICMGPIIDGIGKTSTIVVYFILNLVVFPVLLKYPNCLLMS